MIVSVHACGGLTDLVIKRAVAAGARLAVLPCCHNLEGADFGGLQGWLNGPLAMDTAWVARLRAHVYAGAPSAAIITAEGAPASSSLIAVAIVALLSTVQT